MWVETSFRRKSRLLFDFQLCFLVKKTVFESDNNAKQAVKFNAKEYKRALFFIRQNCSSVATLAKPHELIDGGFVPIRSFPS